MAWGKSRRLVVFHDAAYWYPVSGLEQPTGFDARRADLAVWYLLEKKVIRPTAVKSPAAIEYAQLALVHEAGYLESLSRPEVLMRIFAVDAPETPVDEILRTVRLACGGTLEATREVLANGGSALNMLGGFHHAGPASGGGFCAVNDVAVALAVVRREGFSGTVAVLDLDAHPPDGTAECFRADAKVWIGSISGSSWSPLEGVDETLLPEGSGDDAYLRALTALLGRTGTPDLAFVNAGGDVLAGDRLGKLGLTLQGARERDRRVRDALGNIPSVWLPAGGYGAHSWKVLAGSGLVLAGRERHRISDSFDPLRARFAHVSRGIDSERLGSDPLLSTEELEDALHVPHLGRQPFLGYYSKEGLEFALSRYGVWEQVQRLGYQQLCLDLSRGTDGERLRLLGTADGQEHALVDLVLDRKRIGDSDYLYVNWLTLRNPRACFSEQRPALPGQDVPGLGLAREVSELLGLMAHRLGLTGVAFRPSWYHMAYQARHRFRFSDPARQGRFEALVQALRGVPLRLATQAVAEGRVLADGRPYVWETDEMIQRRRAEPELPRQPPTVQFQLVARRG